ncbi:MAG TPA: carboxy terminal-processing peptidase, partial [Gemmataceae bacterium]|nr:carboxy terminal-processing peptidase [Gemmataceae bacterium]
MTQRIFRGNRYVALLAVLGCLFLIPSPTPAEPKLAKQDRLIARLVCDFLREGHLNKPQIDDEVSRRLFKHFLKGLDPYKLYFTQSDFDEFKKSETDLDDQLLNGDLSFAYKVYERLVKRIEERQKLVEELVNAKHDFEAKESLDTDYDALPYAKNDTEMHERWRKRIKFDLLMQRVGEKPVPEDEAKKKVLSRYESLLKRWKQQMDNSDLLEIYLTDLTTSIDPHSTYMSPTTLDDFEIAMRLNLDGIGAVLRSENGQTVVVEVVPGGAAGKDGRLKQNDKIIGVAQGDGKWVDAQDMKLQDVVKMIRGKRGTKVELKVVPVGKIDPIVIELTRQKVELKSQEARGEVVEQGKKADGKPYKIGVIDLPSFYADQGIGKPSKSATEDVRRLLKEFEAKDVDGVVLDLRRNGGGLLSEAVSLTGLFVDQGPIVQVKGSAGGVKHKDDPEKGTVYGGPLMVLTSRFSASASEILAGALQDYGRALVVGDSATYGKGTVQTVIDLGDQIGGVPPPKFGALKLTIQQFYRVNGDSTQARGVVSDVVLPSLTEHLGVGETEQDYALPFAKVNAIDHENMGLITPELKALLQKRSAERVKGSKDFDKLAKDIELFKERKARKKVTLNEKKLRDQLKTEDADKLDQKVNEAQPSDTPSGDAAYKFKRNYYSDEVLQVMQDFIQGK